MNPAILGIIGSLITKTLFPIIDRVIKSKDEKEKLKVDIIESVNNSEVEIESELTKRLSIDNNGSWLTRNIRPMLLAYLSILCTVLMFLDSEMFNLGVKEQYVKMVLGAWSLAIGFYFGSRGVKQAFEAINKFKNKK